MAQRMIEANGVELCAEAFGEPRDPPILLIMGIGASMLWWEERFCGMLADGGRFVIRYDHRHTGGSGGGCRRDPGGCGQMRSVHTAPSCPAAATQHGRPLSST
jgi:pimeloyl-ACP methyl ester carboxylesterase